MYPDFSRQVDTREPIKLSSEQIVEVQLLRFLACLAISQGDEFQAESYFCQIFHLDNSAYPPRGGWGGGD